MSAEVPSENNDSLRDRVRNKLGAVAGMRPTWFDEQSWDERSPGQRRLIRVMHDRGGSGFRVLRSAETHLKTYQRPDGLSDRDE